ncbi:MAG: tRNA lysidine(34) synthetase TilS [Dehalococcoidales bacterium]
MPRPLRPTIIETEMAGEKKLALEQRVARFMREHGLVASGSCLLLAVSGGADSTCLLHVLVGLREELGMGLHVAHLDHQLRGAESQADAGYVAALAGRLGVPATIEKRDVRAYQKRKRISLEEAAREVRYSFLADVADSIGADKVATGHTLDDHIETILMHLVRGTGTRGLRGLQPSTGWQVAGKPITVVRPLLPLSHRETADYCRSHRLRPRRDTSNRSLSPLRNRIRQQLLPLLRGYNPRVTEALLRTSKVATDELDYLDEEIAPLWGEVARKQGNTVILVKEGFGRLPPALKRHLLRSAFEQLLGNLKDIETRHIEEIMAALDKPAGKQVSLPGGLIFATGYDSYLLGPEPAALCPFPVLEGEVALKIPGETRLPGWHVRARIIEPGPMSQKDNEFTAYFDFDKVGSRLSVRGRRPGDRFQPLGMGQPKKLGEFMIDAKIPGAWRQRVPVVCSPEHIVWLVGWRIDERVKVTGGTKRVLCLEFKRG